MHIASKITDKAQTFQEHYPLIGPAFWIAGIQYFIVMAAVAMAWPTHYSVFNNTISDLGNTACGVYSGRYVCSPWHALMNASFILLGATMAAGSLLIYQEFKRRLSSLIGFSFMGLGGVGTAIVGIYAENDPSSLHVIGALLPFVVGSLGLLALGFSLDMPRSLRIYTKLTGVISLAAFLLFASHHYLGLGIGGMERLAANSQTIWMIVFGVYVSRNHFRERKR